MSTPDVIVIGAGMAGVTAARELVRAGLSVLVVEARDRIGGRIHSVRDLCGEPVEAGAEFIHGVGAEFWPEVRAAGLAVRPWRTTRGMMFDVGHGPQWLPLALLHPGIWPVFTILYHVARVGPHDMSAWQFITQRRYRGRARIMAEMTLTAHLPGSVDEVGMLGLLEDNVLRLERGLNHRVVEGYDRVPAHIATGLDIRRGFTVRAVEWAPSGVTVSAVEGDEVSARAAVCTLPFGVLKSGSVRFVPSLPESKRSAFGCLDMGPVLKILLLFKERFWPEKLASLICGTGPVTLYWPVFSGAADKPAVLTAYCTGPRAAALGTVSEEEAAAIALNDLRQRFPKAAPELVAYRRIDWAADPLACGGYTFVRPGGTGARSRLAAADTGALFWAGSATTTATIADTVQAAFVSGRRAAAEVQAFLGARARAI